jgi:hypothetical protein
MEMEFKAQMGFIKAISGRTVDGIAAVMGNKDDGGDVIWPGSFKKTLSEHRERIKHLWMHNSWDPPTAVIKELHEVGREELPDRVQEKYPEASGGLMVVREYLDTARGNEILEGLKAGAITEMSFAYNPIKWDYETFEDGPMEGQTVRNLRELRLWETSDVTWGMNAATVGSKSGSPLVKQADRIAKQIETLMDVLKGNHDPDIDIEGLRKALAELDAALKAEPVPTVDHSVVARLKVRAAGLALASV